MVDKTSYMFITGPDVIKTVTLEEVTKEQLGGAMTHNETSGVAHFLAHDDAECLSMVRELLSFIPSNNLDEPPRKTCTDPIDRAAAALDNIVPAESNKPYDIKDVIHSVVDDGYFFEVQEHYAKNIVVGFARLDGRSVGIVANQPSRAFYQERRRNTAASSSTEQSCFMPSPKPLYRRLRSLPARRMAEPTA